MQLELSIALFACVIAAISDVRTRRIPNAVPLAVALVGLGFALPHGIATTLTAIALTLMTMVVGTLAFARGWLGGGDVKLLATVTGCLGLADAVPFMMYTAISGGLLAVCFALASGRLPSVARSALRILRPCAFRGAIATVTERPIMMPYALAIASGVIVVALSHSIAPFLRLPL
jgi:prepilin peptidase CpaA